MASGADCVFCKIVAGQIPAFRLHEDDQVLAFLDVGPLSEGHALIIPKAHYARLDDMPAELAGACMAVAPKLAAAIGQALGRTGEDFPYNVLQNNGKAAHQAVGHVHFHIIPKTPEAGLGIQWPAGELDKNKAAELTERVRKEL